MSGVRGGDGDIDRLELMGSEGEIKPTKLRDTVRDGKRVKNGLRKMSKNRKRRKKEGEKANGHHLSAQFFSLRAFGGE